MHVRVVTLRAREGRLDMLVRYCKQSLLPALERQQGFAGFTLGSNRETNRLFGTTLWDDEEAMLAGERGEYFQEQVSRMMHLLAALPEVARYEVELIS